VVVAQMVEHFSLPVYTKQTHSTWLFR
jgi:hypothetical protein